MNPLRDVSRIIFYPMRAGHRKDRPDLPVLPNRFQGFSVQVDHILPAAGHWDGHSHF